MEVFVVFGFNPSNYDLDPVPIRAFYSEKDAILFSDEIGERAKQLKEKMDNIYLYLDDEFPIVDQSSISARIEYLETTKIFEKLNGEYNDIPPSCYAFDYFEVPIE